MRFKDYIYLSRLNIKRNKKRSRRTILSLVIGLTFSILTLYVLIGFNLSALSHLDNDAKFNTFLMHYAGENAPADASKYYIPVKDRNKIRQMDGIDTVIPFNYVIEIDTVDKRLVENNWSLESQLARVKYDGKEEYIYDDGGIYAINDLDLDYFNNYSMYYYEKPFLEFGRKAEKSGEIMVSKEFLTISKISIDEAIGKKISISTYSRLYGAYNKYYDNNGQEIDSLRIDIVNNMTIVGVYNSFYKGVYPLSGFGIITEDSLYYPKQHVESEKKAIATYNKIFFDEDLRNMSDSNGKVVRLHYGDDTYSDYIFFKNYKYSHLAYENIAKEYSDNIASCISKDRTYIPYIEFHKTIDNITIFISVISLIILVISLLNCFEIIGYNIIKKQKNLGMMKALGMSDKGILKMHITEFSLLMFKSTILSLIFSFIPAIILTIYGNKSINYEAIGFDVGFHINIIYYFVSLLLVVGIMYLLIYLYLIIVTRKLVKNKAITILKGMK